VSTGRFASLNFSWKWPEPGCGADENHRLLALHEGYRREKLYLVRQSHGNDGVCCDDCSPAQTLRVAADYLVCARVAHVCAVITADCVPVLLWEPQARCVAAVHSGWRGTLADVVGVAVTDLQTRYGAESARMRVAVGPHIGPCCFEVGEDVAQRFESVFGRGAAGPAGLVHRHSSTRPHVDLAAAIGSQLAARSIQSENIEWLNPCTYCDGERFYSYRRDGIPVGQHMSFIGLRG
jgi:hypothetical protein